MRRAISAYSVFLLLSALCLTSAAAYGRELLGAKIHNNFQAFSHKQEANDKVAELEATVEKLMQVVINLQNELELDKLIRSFAIDGDANCQSTEKWPNIYDALRYLNNTDAWQNSTIASMQASISALRSDVDANTANITTIDVDVAILQANLTLISTNIVKIDDELTTDEDQIQENTDAIAKNSQQITTNAEDIQSLSSELTGMELLEDHFTVTSSDMS